MKNEGVSDFLDNQIVSGAWIVYPHRRGSNLEMKLGHVTSVEDGIVKVRHISNDYNYKVQKYEVSIGRESALWRPDRATVIPAASVPAVFAAAMET